MDNKITKKCGSFTIELSLIMPLLFAVFLLILYADYYMHDRVIIEKCCYISALRSALCSETEKKEYVAANYIETELENRLLGRWEYEISIETDEEISKVFFNGNMIVSEGLFNKIVNKKAFKYKTSSMVKRNNETKHLRNMSGRR